MREKDFLNRVSYNFEQFYQYTKRYCEKYDKKVTIVNKPSLTVGGSFCTGWCDGDEMVVAFDNPYFEQTYCHEFCHLMQAREGSQFWNIDFKFWKLLDQKKLHIKNWPQLISVLQLERDCEARALRMSKKYNLFNNNEYCRRANLYLYYYQYVFLKQKWLRSPTIFDSELIYRKMPTTLVKMRDLSRIDMNMMLLFENVQNGTIIE